MRGCEGNPMITCNYVGVDISKNWFDICTSLDAQAQVERFKNNEEGRRLFVKKVNAIAAKIHVCMEYTGGYETPLALLCRAEGFAVSLIDGGKFSTYRKSFGRAKAKTDLQDAKLLARYASERRPPIWVPVPAEYQILRDLVRHRQNLVKAKNGWGCRVSYQSQDPIVTSQRRTIVEVYKFQIKELEEKIKAHIMAFTSLKEALDLLLTIPGIASLSATRILAEAGPISNYKSAREYAMAAGLCPIVIHSGLKTPPGKLPRYGNAELRCAFYYPVVCSVAHEFGVYKFMQKVASNGNKVKMTVICAGMRKLACIVYGVLSTNTKYDPTKS
jgi:transposase